MNTDRLLAVRAGPFRLCLPLLAVRQIIDVGDSGGSATAQQTPLALAEVLGARSTSASPGHLVLDGPGGPLLLSVDEIHGIISDARVTRLPETVRIRWPGLLAGTVRTDDIFLILEPAVLIGIIEAEHTTWPAAEVST